MLSLACSVNSDCPFQYECISAICTHYPMFPLQIYPAVIYFIVPFLICISNIGGLSGGIFKVIIFMDLLNYNASQATPLIASVNAGGALANFILLIFRRHPYRNTSLVDFNLVFIVIPAMLIGTTVGVVVSRLLNDLTQDIMLVIVCFYFALVFIKKYNHKRRVLRKESEESIREILVDTDDQQYKIEERIAFDKHEAGMHGKEIIIAIALFAVLLFLTALSQGTVTGFGICTKEYLIGTVSYLLVMAVVIVGIYKFTYIKQQFMKKIRYIYQVDLNDTKTYLTILGGGVMAGFLQGAIGMGSGHMLSYALLGLDFLPQVISGTSGFLVAFTTAATLVEEIAIKGIAIQDALFLGGITFGISLVGTFFAVRYLQKKSSIGSIILLILGLLCLASIAGVAVNLVMTIHYFGVEALLKWRSVC